MSISHNFHVTKYYSLIFFSRNCLKSLSLWAIQKQVAGWIWPISCSLPIPVLKQRPVESPGATGERFLSMRFQTAHITHKRFSTRTAASSRQPANNTSLLRLFWSWSLLPFSLTSFLKSQRLRHGRGKGRRNPSADIGKEQLTPFPTTGFWAWIWPNLGRAGAGQLTKQEILN